MELYKKYRPPVWEHVVGCDATVASAKSALARDEPPHAYLLSGPTGCGKTTLARIIRDELECHDMDFVEINSASFRGIDMIRKIQDTMRLSPQAGKARVWLLDEAHMMSRDAQNAALKMLEDTPAHVYFLICTTEPGKLLAAIRNRCLELPVKLLTDDDLRTIYRRVDKAEKIGLDKKALDDCVDAANGSGRAFLMLLEKIRDLPADQRRAALEQGTGDEESEGIDLCRALMGKAPWKEVGGIIKTLKGDPESVRRAVLGYARNALLAKENYQAYLILDCFKNHFYDSGTAGLALAAFEVIKSGK